MILKDKYKNGTLHNVINPGGGIIKGTVVGHKVASGSITHIVFTTEYHPSDYPLITPVGILLKKGVINDKAYNTNKR